MKITALSNLFDLPVSSVMKTRVKKDFLFSVCSSYQILCADHLIERFIKI